jgi:small nuclear ribonucleoprotein (snRNP)-like protein
MKAIFVFTVLFLTVNSLFAQVKIEKETRIKPEEAPEIARNFIEKIGFENKIKWYREEGIEDTSFEAKTKHNGKLHSVEFSENGILEDVEVLIKWKLLPIDLQEKITNHLADKYDKFSIEKTQIQYIGNEDDIISFLNDGQGKNALQISYELVVETKTGKALKVYEYLFSAAGVYIQSKEVVFRNTDNLIY